MSSFLSLRGVKRRSNLAKAAHDEIAALHVVPLAMTILYAIARRLLPCHCEE